MDFTKPTEKKSYRVGLRLGFLFSYLLFFSILYYVLNRFHVNIPVAYLWYILILVGIHLIYLAVKPIIIKRRFGQ
ncbi:MAG: hypothetical protein WC916_05200 [Candidatus Woesearchaeota archaeon]